MTSTTPASAAGRFTFPGTDISVNRMGFGAMQLAGPHVFGEPKDPEECRAVLSEAIALGIDHIDTSDFYGPYVTNRLIAETLHPYPENLTLVTKIGGWRDDEGGWNMDHSPAFLRKSVEDNLERLKLDQVAIVNLRMGSATGFSDDSEIEEPMLEMRRMQEEGLIAHIGLSTVTEAQIRIAQDIAPIVCVQNHYNLIHRDDDAMIDSLAEQGIAYVPYFPLGGFLPYQAEVLDKVASELGSSIQKVSLAWLLQRSSNMLVIPGTSSRAHLRDNIAAAELTLGEDHLKRLDAIAAKG
ncbi:oxidoreductase [Martelella endophytica]|uniref:Oxidoreductase n=1 Tax=Martelella endophytica TaxID=1486262 RepID=A0A0D5LQH9_MAREN|nr:oxidoreductase [Martelella endophytica]AJY46371.1 oxidoreductase [Martelella endophytica]